MGFFFVLFLFYKVPKIPGYYKRNRHFQCCIETKLLMIWPKHLHGFVVHVFKLQIFYV